MFWCVYLIPEVQGRPANSFQVLSPGESLLIPIGRSLVNENSVEIRINDKILPYGTIYDGYGGYWAKVSCDKLGENSNIRIRYIRHQEAVSTYRHQDDASADWITPSVFIDSDNYNIQEKAHQLYVKTRTIEENVKSISDFITGHIEFNHKHKQTPPASRKASATLLHQKGVCINFSRLFIALCRASGIGARSVSGVVLSREHPDRYDFHHEWAEYLDEDRVWHPIDLTYEQTLNLSDIRYTDLVYAAEDHEYFANSDNKNLSAGRPLQLNNKDIILFHYHPIFPGAKYGFQLIEDHRPEFFIIEKTINIIKNENQIIIMQSSDSSGISNQTPENLDALIELNTPIKSISEREYNKINKVQIPKWLKRYNGKTFTYNHKMFRTKKIKFETDYKTNTVFVTEYDDKNNPTRYQLGLAKHHFANKTRRGMEMGAKAMFKKNTIVIDIAVPQLGWRAKGSYIFSDDTIELSVLDLYGNTYQTKGSIFE